MPLLRRIGSQLGDPVIEHFEMSGHQRFSTALERRSAMPMRPMFL